MRTRTTRLEKGAGRSIGVVVLAMLAGCGGTTGAGAQTPRGQDDGAGASSDVLALLPEGTEKQKFLMDCTGCHQFDAERAFPNGIPRSEADWRDVVARMLPMGGVGGASPLISPDRDPASTARWLAAHLDAPPSTTRAVPAVPAGAEITPFDFPFPQDLPHDVAVDADGRVIVTGMFTHQMVRLDPADGSWERFAIPVAGANPRAVEIDDAGDWWVLLGEPGKIARYRVADEAWDTWDIGMYGHSLRLDDAGRVWFNGHFTRHPTIIGWLDVASEEVTTVEIPNEPAPAADHPMPYGLRVGVDGRIWGTELRGGRLFSYDPASGRTTVHPMPDPHGGPRRPAVGADGRVWIPEFAGNRLTRFDPTTAEFRSFDFPISSVLPYVAEVDRRTGLVWVGTAAADLVFSFDPATEAFTAYPMPTRDALIRHLVVDEERGEVWAAYGAFPGIAPRIVRIRPTGGKR
ncbi:MAG: hypothetical protein ACODAB_03230 [Gemmatimonadota bacterium]